jgi:hypothetical protein
VLPFEAAAAAAAAVEEEEEEDVGGGPPMDDATATAARYCGASGVTSMGGAAWAPWAGGGTPPYAYG